MSEGTTTFIRDQSVFDNRMAMVERDGRAIMAHGSSLLVTVCSWQPKGSHQQSALFHLLCEHIAQWWTGRHPQQPTSKEAVKRDLKVKFGRIETVYSPISDQRVARLCSWSEYTKAERNALITATFAWMAEQGIPDLPEIPASEYAKYREAAQ